MQLGMIGLGRMGANMVRRLMQHGHECVVFDTNAGAVAELNAAGAQGTSSIEEFITRLKAPRAVWIMLPVPVVEGVMAGPTSTLIGATLLNLLMLEVIDWLKAGGHALPILRSQNMPNAIEYNRELGKKYKGRLSRQLA